MVQLRLDSAMGGKLPSDCFMSVRVGKTQHLARIADSRTYSYPQAGDCRFGKIDVFKRIGSCSVDIDPAKEGLRDVRINCKDGGFGDLGLKIAVAPDASSPEKKLLVKEDYKVQTTKLRSYLNEHGLESRLSEAMAACLREQPADPAAFIANMLQSSNYNKVKIQQSAQPGSKDANSANQNAATPAQGKLANITMSLERSTAAPKLYAKFPNFRQPTPSAPVQTASATAKGAGFQFKPSAGTWLAKKPVSLAPAPCSTKFNFKPSVGSWLAASPEAPFPFPHEAASCRLRGLSPPSTATNDQKVEVERILAQALCELKGELAGEYYPLRGSASYASKPQGMSDDDSERLRNAGVLFSAYEPSGCGVFVAGDITAWVNEGSNHIKFVVKTAALDAIEKLGRIENAIRLAVKQEGYELDR